MFLFALFYNQHRDKFSDLLQYDFEYEKLWMFEVNRKVKQKSLRFFKNLLKKVFKMMFSDFNVFFNTIHKYYR